jgi:hypothetical protein
LNFGVLSVGGCIANGLGGSARIAGIVGAALKIVSFEELNMANGDAFVVVELKLG